MFKNSEWINDKDILSACCHQNGLAIQYVTHVEKDLAMIACQQNGRALALIDPVLRMDKEVVIAAVTSDPESLKYALDGLNQHPDCLIAAKLCDDNYHQYHRSSTSPDSNSRSINIISEQESNPQPIKIVLSTKFSLNETSSSVATKFTLLLKEHPYAAMSRNKKKNSSKKIYS